jgi:hypothetical protein
MNKFTSITGYVAVVLGLCLAAANGHAASCAPERARVDAAFRNAQRACSGPATEETLHACLYAEGVFMEAADQYDQCVAMDQSGPRG